MTSRFDSAVGLEPITQTTDIKKPAVKASRFDSAIDRTPEPPPTPNFFDKLLTKTKEVIKPVADFGASILGEKKPQQIFNVGEGMLPEQKLTAQKVIQDNIAKQQYENQITKERQQKQLTAVGQVVGLASLPLIGPELAAKPVATLLQAGLFSGIDYVANKLNLHASNLAPEDASDKTKLALDVLQMVGEGFLAHGIYKKAPEVATKFTKNVVSTYSLPEQYTIPATTVRDIQIGNKAGLEASKKDFDTFVQATGGDRTKIMAAVKNGLDVTIPAEGVTKLVDKPFWAKIKNTIGIPSTDKILNTNRFGNVIQTPKALIGESSSYVPPPVIPQKALPSVPTPLSLEAKNPVIPGTPTQGQGFTMLDKATKPQVASAKLYADYNAAVKSFTANPTPTKLKQVQDLRAQVRASSPTAPASAPAISPTNVPVMQSTPITAPVVQSSQPIAPAVAPQPSIPGLKSVVETPKVVLPIQQSGIAKAASDINRTLVSKGFAELSPEQLAKIDPITKEKTINKITEIMNNPVAAKAQLYDENSKFTGPERQVLFNAVKNHAGANSDYQTLIDLANHPIATERSQAAQTLGASGFNNGGEDSVSAIQEVQKSRTKNLESKRKVVSDSLDTEIKQSKTRPKKQDWNEQGWKDFVKSIKCK